EELASFLRIPSVSALPAHAEDVRRAAEWVAAALREAGLERVAVLPTAGHPVVCGEWMHAEGAPTALVYGHYDVQPVDPLDEWETPPFEPSFRGGRVYARGASDDKGQVFAHIKAVQGLLALQGRLPVNLRFVIEGEEEIGSPNLADFLRTHPDRARADVAVISDSTMLAPGVPTLCYGLRGLAACQVDVSGPRSDLHSGLYGGVAPNPLHALAELIASLHDDDGRVAVPGFYDDVRPLSQEEREAFAALPFDEAELRATVGAPDLVGEAGYTPLERLWARPTLEVNGAWGGFQGDGTKTVIPARAHAKITCRLVPDQDPGRVLDALEAHLHRRCPRGVVVSVRRFAGSARACLTPVDHPAVQAAARALRRAFGAEPRFVRMGGSIPIVETLHHELGLPVVLMGFALSTENFHAPNEHFHLENFDRALLSLAAFWQELASWRP
ncbi:MAG: dipeptidase, partial [Clostridia bacterium]|nr:dipeptidase [Clostridia bacterium]